MTVKRWPGWKVATGGTQKGSPVPPIKTRERAELDCGCKAIVGTRMDNGEAATAAWACSEAHHPITEAFNRAMLASVGDKRYHDRKLVDVADEFLTQAAADFHADTGIADDAR